MDCFAPVLLNVQMWATLSSPYFCLAYSITLSLCLSSKSKSMSGIDFLPSTRNLSNNRPNLIGSKLVIPKAYERILPAAEPLPQPTVISLDLAQRTRSETTKKYSGKPISFTTLISCCALSIIFCGKFCPYFSLRPSHASLSKYSVELSFVGIGKLGKCISPKSNLRSIMSYTCMVFFSWSSENTEAISS